MGSVDSLRSQQYCFPRSMFIATKRPSFAKGVLAPGLSLFPDHRALSLRPLAGVDLRSLLPQPPSEGLPQCNSIISKNTGAEIKRSSVSISTGHAAAAEQED